MVRYEIEGGNLPVVICDLDSEQTLCTESGAMSWMTPNIKMKPTQAADLKRFLVECYRVNLFL